MIKEKIVGPFFFTINGKSQWACMSVTHQSEARGLERLMWLKYYNVQKWQITFTLGLNAAKNTTYMEKSIK